MNPVPAKRLGQVGQLHPVSQVGLVGAEALDHLVVRQPRERRAHLDALRLGDDARVQRLDHVDDVLLVDERHLHVELRELEPAFGGGPFVTEAPDDLVVAVLAGHHQHLLQLLRRLREGVERARPVRDGTRKSRAPSGVLRVRSGVSTSTNPSASMCSRMSRLIV